MTCCTVAWDGESSAVAARASAVDLLAQCEKALRADPTIAGTALVAQLVPYQLSQRADTSGSTAIVRFQVQYRARI